MSKNQKENPQFFLRQGPDAIMKMIRRSIQASWGLGIIALVLACAAMPLAKDLLNFTFNTKLDRTWNFTFLEIDFYLTIITFCISVLGLYLSSLRQRRRTDRYNISMIVIGILSAISIIIYLIFF